MSAFLIQYTAKVMGGYKLSLIQRASALAMIAAEEFASAHPGELANNMHILKSWEAHQAAFPEQARARLWTPYGRMFSYQTDRLAEMWWAAHANKLVDIGESSPVRKSEVCQRPAPRRILVGPKVRDPSTQLECNPRRVIAVYKYTDDDKYNSLRELCEMSGLDLAGVYKLLIAAERKD